MSLPRSFSKLLCGAGRASQETSYEKACSDRRGSAPATPALGLRAMDSAQPSRFANFFSKRSFKNNPLKRTKSVTKLERKHCTIDGDSVPPSRLRTSRSHESLLQSSPSALATLDLAHGGVQVSALHCSILGQENCFQMVSNGTTRFYTCRTREERDRWLYSLRKTVQPNQDSVRRRENSLRIWILEAKGIVTKKNKYYCELCLDKTLYARTSSKQKADMCFWGEHFEFSGLPNVENIYVNLYKEADKKKRRDKNVLIGSVHIPVSVVNGRHLVEKWYQVVSEKNFSGKDTPSIRIKSRFQTVEILPLVVYKELLTYLKSNYKVLCEMLEPVISVRAKEDVATILVNIMHNENMAKEFLSDVVMSDIEKIGDLHLTFRGNSLATKATEAYMKLMGNKYLQETLGIFLKMALDGTDDCEVDPMKVMNSAVLQRQQANLMTYVEMVWVKIINSSNIFPVELQEVFHEYRKRLTSIGKEELCENLISASIFLRFLCPAILSPSLFNLSQEYPQGRSARNLTLVAKTIQTLANFTRFGGKESFMEFMNGFVEKEWSTMKSFLRQISSPSSKEFLRKTEFDRYIDIGKELSVLHGLLVEAMCKINQRCYFEQVDKLQTILDKISVALVQPPQIACKMNVLPSTMIGSKILSQNLNIGTISNKQDFVHDKPDVQEQKNDVTYLMDIDVRSSNGECHSFTFLSPKKTGIPVTPTNRPSTLPRNAYLMGSAKKPAADLSTSDDYVLYSAFDADIRSKENQDDVPEEKTVALKQENVLSLLNVNDDSQRYKSPINIQPGSGVVNSVDIQQKNANNRTNLGLCHSSKNNIVSKNLLTNGTKLLTLEEAKEVTNKLDNADGHEDFANSSTEIEISNAKGSQISIGQLSTVASSGYQSFPYSQSNSPIDLTYQQEACNILQSGQHPLAFNNPMYHFPASQSYDPKKHTQCKHLQMSHFSAFSSLSAEDISVLCHSSLGAADSTPVLPTNVCHFSSSSGTASCDSTPPAERRNNQFKSTAPRTNPHYFGSQLPCNICATCSPRLSTRAMSHPIRYHHYHQNKNCLCTMNLLYNKFRNSACSALHQIPKCNLNFSAVEGLDKNSNVQAFTLKNNEKADIKVSSKVIKNKSLEDYEREIEELKLQMLALQAKLTDAEGKLFKQESTTVKVVADWQARLEAGEERIRKQQEEKDEQMKNIITRLITVEEELRHEQQEMQGVIISKQKIIEAQERKIQSLDATNTKLLGALSQLKERYELRGKNGNSSPNSPVKLAVLNNSDVHLKTSSC